MQATSQEHNQQHQPDVSKKDNSQTEGFGPTKPHGEGKSHMSNLPTAYSSITQTLPGNIQGGYNAYTHVLQLGGQLQVGYGFMPNTTPQLGQMGSGYMDVANGMALDNRLPFTHFQSPHLQQLSAAHHFTGPKGKCPVPVPQKEKQHCSNGATWPPPPEGGFDTNVFTLTTTSHPISSCLLYPPGPAKVPPSATSHPISSCLLYPPGPARTPPLPTSQTPTQRDRGLLKRRPPSPPKPAASCASKDDPTEQPQHKKKTKKRKQAITTLPRPSQPGANLPVSIYRGVSYSRRDQRWVARVYVQGKVVHLGMHDNETVGALLVDLEKIKTFGDSCAKRMNFETYHRIRLCKEHALDGESCPQAIVKYGKRFTDTTPFRELGHTSPFCANPDMESPIRAIPSGTVANGLGAVDPD